MNKSFGAVKLKKKTLGNARTKSFDCNWKKKQKQLLASTNIE